MKNKSNKASAAAVCFVRAAVEGKAETDCGEAECTGSGKSLLEWVSSNQRSRRVTRELFAAYQTDWGRPVERKQTARGCWSALSCCVEEVTSPFPPSSGSAISRRTQFVGLFWLLLFFHGSQWSTKPSAPVGQLHPSRVKRSKGRRNIS